jgi:hypothetical protein
LETTVYRDRKCPSRKIYSNICTLYFAFIEIGCPKVELNISKPAGPAKPQAKPEIFTDVKL